MSGEHLQISRETPKENTLKNIGKHLDRTGGSQSDDSRGGFMKGHPNEITILKPGKPVELYGAIDQFLN